MTSRPRHLVAGVPRHLERLRQLEQIAQLTRLEVDLLEKTSVLQVERHGKAPGEIQNAASRSIGQVMQWPPPRPVVPLLALGLEGVAAGLDDAHLIQAQRRHPPEQ